jgi:hypothetical protein
MTHKALTSFLTGLFLLSLGLMLPGQARAQQPIKVIYPDISTQWVAGNDYTVRWTETSVGRWKANVILQQKRTLNFIYTEGEIPNLGSHTFHVREDIPSGIYRIKVTAKIGGDWGELVTGDSPWFKLTNPRDGGFIPYK